MISIALQIVESLSFVALLVLVWRVSKRPKWRIRAVVYGWGAFFLLSLFWSCLMPALFHSLGLHLPVDTFPDGTIAMGALLGGWIWPLVVVAISAYYQDRKKTPS
jgi:hypothetical protein